VETREIDRERPAADRPVARRDRPRAVDAEVPFAVGEIFFSRTNAKGHILFGNGVFQRISHYSWAELCRSPHSIVRHPDMPRAVFWLLWDAIEKGEPVGAYVKNMAKDGRFYWVYAIVTPIEGGFLSVRIKPASPMLAIVEREYEALLAVENKRRLKPAESARILLNRLSELGFRDYGAFMAATLSLETRTRDEQLGRPLDKAAASFETLTKEAAALLELAEGVVGEYEEHRFVPLNLRVHAAGLGEAGAAIGVIAMNYDGLATALKSMTAEFIEAARQLFAAVNKGLFLIATARIQQEACDRFAAETSTGASAAFDEIALLERQRKAYEEHAAAGLGAIVSEARRFEQSCMEMKKAAAALETARIMGKVESARLGAAAAGALGKLLEDLERYQSRMREGLQQMFAMSERIERDASRLL
jgi:hypothetical protein